MRAVFAILLALTGLAGLSGCSRHTPPAGRWEGTYDSPDTMIVARMAIDSKGQIFVSAPDALNIANASPAEREAMRTRLAQGLDVHWSDVQPRTYDFDGTTFRKPGGMAPQARWHKNDNTMALYIYYGMTSVVVPLHPVTDFSENPWPH